MQLNRKNETRYIHIDMKSMAFVDGMLGPFVRNSANSFAST